MKRSVVCFDRRSKFQCTHRLGSAQRNLKRIAATAAATLPVATHHLVLRQPQTFVKFKIQSSPILSAIEAAARRRKNGVSLRYRCGGGGPGSHWSKGRHKLEEFERNPELLRTGFQNVADKASAMVVRGLER
jgi:hypothetical protein